MVVHNRRKTYVRIIPFVQPLEFWQLLGRKPWPNLGYALRLAVCRCRIRIHCRQAQAAAAAQWRSTTHYQSRCCCMRALCPCFCYAFSFTHTPLQAILSWMSANLLTRSTSKTEFLRCIRPYIDFKIARLLLPLSFTPSLTTALTFHDLCECQLNRVQLVSK